MLEPTEFASHVSGTTTTSTTNEQDLQRAHEGTPPPDDFEMVVAITSPNELTLFMGQSLLPTSVDGDTFYIPSWCFSPTVNNRNVRVDRSWNPNISKEMKNFGIIGSLLGISKTTHDPSLVFPDYSAWPYTVVFSEKEEKVNETSETNKTLVLPLFRHLRHLHQPKMKDILTCEHVTAKQAKLLVNLLSSVRKMRDVLFSKSTIIIKCPFLNC